MFLTALLFILMMAVPGIKCAYALQEDINIVIKKAKLAAGEALATSHGKKDTKKKTDSKKKKKVEADSSDAKAEVMEEDSTIQKQRHSPRLKPTTPLETPKWGEKVDKKRKRAEEERHEAGEDAGNQPLSDFDISKETQAKLAEAGITSLFPIQAATFRHVMAGKDLIARARTGTGKTLSFVLLSTNACCGLPVRFSLVNLTKLNRITGKTLSFVLPVHERLLALRTQGLVESAAKRGRAPVCLILSPTRELTKQIGKVFETCLRMLTYADV